MSLVPLTNWYDKVLIDMPGCPENVALDKIRDAAIEWCARSWAHNRWLDPMPVTANVAEIEFADYFSEDYQVLVSEVLEGRYAGHTYLPYKAPDALKELYCGDYTTRTGTPEVLTQERMSAVRLVPVPGQSLANGLKLRVAFKPKRAATQVNDELWEHYAEDIAAGAIAKLQKMTKKPWTNPQAGQAAQLDFQGRAAAVKTRVQRGFGRARRQTRGSYF